MENCHDFQNEVTQLQTIASSYGIRVEMTPKYHAEIAGCGIEYSWGAAKSRYRQIPLERKRKKHDLKEAVRHSIDVLTKQTVRKCDRKARTYIQAYFYLEVMRQGEGAQPDEQLSLSTAAPLTLTGHSAIVLLAIMCNCRGVTFLNNKKSLVECKGECENGVRKEKSHKISFY